MTRHWSDFPAQGRGFVRRKQREIALAASSVDWMEGHGTDHVAELARHARQSLMDNQCNNISKDELHYTWGKGLDSEQ
jgi:hypothetical protein